MTTLLTEIADYLASQSWQIAVLIAVVAVGCWLLRAASAHWRYLLWLVVLGKCLVPPMLTIALPVLPQLPPNAIEAPSTVVVADESEAATASADALAVQAAQPIGESGAQPEVSAGMDAEPAPAISTATVEPASTSVKLTPAQWAAVAWALGAAVLFLWTGCKIVRVHRRLKRTRRRASHESVRVAANLAGRMGLRTVPAVWSVEGFSQPFVWGLWRGAIYLPADFEKQTDAEHRREILGHELAHVARRDAAVNALQLLVGGLMFFHPLMWWANRKIRQEREKCCDEVAIAALRSQPKLYGTAIVGALVAEHRATPSLAVAGPARNVEERIKTIMTPNRKFHKRPTRLAALTALILAALTVPTALTLTARAVAENAEKVDRPAPVANLLANPKLLATFSNGATAELLAISKLHEKEQQWWAPEGMPLKAGPYGGMKDALPMYDYEMVLRFKGPANSDDRWGLAGGSNTTNIGRPKDAAGKSIADLRACGIGLPDRRKDSKQVTVRYGAAMGKWQTKATYRLSEGNEKTVEVGSSVVAFSRPYVKDDMIHLNLAHTLRKLSKRVIAIDTKGRELPNLGYSGSARSGLAMTTYRFGKLALKDVDRFEFQTRPYEWVEFKNVSLRPGIATKVRVIEDRPGAKTEIYPGVIREYIGKKVADFPAGVNLSSPAAAAATWNRAWGSADTDAIIKTSSRKMTRQQVDKFWQRRERVYDRALMDSTVVEVLTYRKNLAAVITYLPSPQGRVRAPYSRRSFGLFDGKWKNLGEDRLGSVKAAREGFNLKKDNIWKKYERILKGTKKEKAVLKDPTDVRKTADELFAVIRTADYDRYLKGEDWRSFPTIGRYEAIKWHDALVSWICKTFKTNPIQLVELGTIFTDKSGRPVVPYRLTLKDGAVLKGELPFEYSTSKDRWFGKHGIDWHLKYPDGIPVADNSDAKVAEAEFYYHTLDSITVNLNEPRLNRYVAVTIVLAIRKDDEKAGMKLIEARKPRLRDSLNAYFGSRTMKDVAGEKNQNRIRRELRDLFNKKLGGDKSVITQVLFEKFNVQ